MPASQAKLLGQAACYIHPLGGRVLIRPTEAPSHIRVGGMDLTVPDQAKDMYPTEGTVVDTGPDVPLVPKLGPDGLPEKDETGQEVMQALFQPGDRVVYSRYTGFLLTFGDGEKFLLVPYEDIAGVLDPKCPVLGKEPEPAFNPR